MVLRALAESALASVDWPGMLAGAAATAARAAATVANTTLQRCLSIGLITTDAVSLAYVRSGRASFSESWMAAPRADTYMVHYALWLVAAITLCAVALLTWGARRYGRRTKVSGAERTVGPYLLLQQLGSGGMGRVYLAEHRQTRGRCALKVIHPERADDAAILTRFEREVQSLAALSHPHVVRVQDYGRAADGTLYYAMELVAGVTLDELVGREGPIHPARVVAILRQLCDALDDAHWRGLIHRDLKPGNVMLSERAGVRDFAVLLDFGLVGAVEKGPSHSPLTRADVIMGTPGFMAPEQWGDGQITTATDIYSIGAIGYFLLSGRSPFGERPVVEMLAAQLTEEPLPVAEVRCETPRALSDVIARCLRVEPGDRYPDVGALSQALAKSLPSAA